MAVQNSTFAATVGGAVTAIVMWAMKTWGQTDIPAEVATSVTTIVMAVITHLVPDTASTSPTTSTKLAGQN